MRYTNRVEFRTLKEKNKMGRPLKVAKQETGGTYHDLAIPSIASNELGAIGGDPTLTGYQVIVRVKIGANAEADGWILRQKGRSKFYVTDGTNFGTCTLADLNDAALTNDTMTITVTDSGSSAFRLKRISNKFAWDFSNVRYFVSMTTTAAAPGNPPPYWDGEKVQTEAA